MANDFTIRGYRLKNFILSLLVLDTIDDSDRLSGMIRNGLIVATILNERKKWKDKTLGGVFPLSQAVKEVLAEFHRFSYLNAPSFNHVEWQAEGILELLVHPPEERGESGGQKVFAAQPLIDLFKRFQSGEINW